MEPNSQENIPQRREHPQKCFTLRNTTIRTQTQVLPRKTSCTDTFPSVWRQIGLLPLTPLTTGSSDWLEPQKITFCILFKKKKIFPSNLIGASILPSWNLFFHVLAVLLRFPKLINLGYTGLAFHFKNIFLAFYFIFQLHWGTIDKNYTYLRRATWWFDTSIHCEIFTTIKLINISTTLHSYHFLFFPFCGENTVAGIYTVSRFLLFWVSPV